MSAPQLRHTPYFGSRKPFSIGLAPIDPANWIEPDSGRDTELARKDALLAEKPEITIYSESGTEASQFEIRDALVGFLCDMPGGDYVREANGVRIGGDRFVPFDKDELALVNASRLIQDDLCLMRRDERGWRLVAASLCFPSSWSLIEKGGGSLDDLHAFVPGYQGALGTRMARIFDNLPVGNIVERLNWSISDDGEFHKPLVKKGRKSFGDPGVHFGENAFVRVERQTLRRMPVSGDILFTIKIHTDQLAGFRQHPQGAELALALRGQIGMLDADQLNYKGMTLNRDELMAGLAGLAEEIGGVTV